MPQDTPSQLTEAALERTEGGRQWLTRFLSGWKISDRGKVAATVVLALLRGRAGRTFLKRIVMGSVFIVYNHLRLVEVIVGVLVLAEVATRLIIFLTRRLAVGNSLPGISTSNDENATRESVFGTSTGNDGQSSPTGSPTRGRTRQQEAIQNHLHRLAMAAAAADGEGSTARGSPSQSDRHRWWRATASDGNGSMTSNSPSQSNDHRWWQATPSDVPSRAEFDQRERLTIEYPDRNGTCLAVTTFPSSSNSAPAAANSHELIRSPNSSSNPWTDPPRQASNYYHDSRAIERSSHLRKHPHSTDGPDRLVKVAKQSVVIRIRLPVYVCDLTFWNEVQITVPFLFGQSSPPPSTTAAENNRPNEDRASTSRSNGSSSEAAGRVYHIEMRMWVETNRDLVSRRTSTRNTRNRCEDCLMGSHSVRNRRFDCTYQEGALDGAVDVHKNTFHEGLKLTIVGSNKGLNFKFETALEQTVPKTGNYGPAAFQQRVTFTLLPTASRPNSQTSKNQQQVDRRGKSRSTQGRGGSGLLAAVLRKSASSSRLTPLAKCSVESFYTLEDRRLLGTHNGGSSSGWGQGESGLDQRLFGSTIASGSS